LNLVRYERQLVLREWGTAGQAALEAASAVLACSGGAFAVAERYLQAAGIARVQSESREATAPREVATFVASLESLPWHASEARTVGVGAAHAVDFLVRTLREAPR
jgi:hypothetical protein